MRSVDMNSDIGSLRRNITEQIFDLRGRTVTKFGKKPAFLSKIAKHTYYSSWKLRKNSLIKLGLDV